MVFLLLKLDVWVPPSEPSFLQVNRTNRWLSHPCIPSWRIQCEWGSAGNPSSCPGSCLVVDTNMSWLAISYVVKHFQLVQPVVLVPVGIQRPVV